MTRAAGWRAPLFGVGMMGAERKGARVRSSQKKRGAMTWEDFAVSDVWVDCDPGIDDAVMLAALSGADGRGRVRRQCDPAGGVQHLG